MFYTQLGLRNSEPDVFCPLEEKTCLAILLNYLLLAMKSYHIFLEAKNPIASVPELLLWRLTQFPSSKYAAGCTFPI